MNNTTKTEVRRSFTSARELMRQADLIMSQSAPDLEHAEQVALELAASVNAFLEWVEAAK